MLPLDCFFHSTKLIGAFQDNIIERDRSQYDMSSHIIIQYITQQCRSSQVCCRCRRKHFDRMIFIKSLSIAQLIVVVVIYFLMSYEVMMKGVPVPSKWRTSPPALASWPQPPYHLYHSPPLIDAWFYIWTIYSRASAYAVYLSPFTRQGTLLPHSFVITSARNYHHNMCNDRSTRPTMTKLPKMTLPVSSTIIVL